MGNTAFTPIILVHLLTALGAVIAGGLTLILRKGTPTHRMLGRIWVLLIVTTALVSFGIRRHGGFSPIHVLSVISLVTAALSVYAAMHGRINAHRRGMTALYVSLVIAGLLTLLPNRRLGYLVWHAAGLM